MEERQGFSVRELIKQTFFPFKSKWANLSFYIIPVVLSVPCAIKSTNDYRALARYGAGEISREYKTGPLGYLERWICADKDKK